jgi:hypothetical protein
MIDFLREAAWLTQARARRIAILFFVISIAAVTWDFANHMQNGVTDAHGEHLARDYVQYWATGRITLQGLPIDVYDVDALSSYVRTQVGPISERVIYPYPPIAQLVMAPLGAFGYLPGLVLWIALGTFFNLLLLRRDLGIGMASLAAMATPAVFVNTISGQNGQLVSAFLGSGILLLDRSPVWAGVLMGGLCWKPQIGLLIPVALAASGRWRSFFAAAATVLVLVLSSLVVLGPEAWVSFFRQTEVFRAFIGANELVWHRLPTVFAAAREAGAGLGLSYALQLVSTLAAAASVAITWHGGASLRVKGAALIFALYLATPYCWDYDMVVMTLAIVWMAREASGAGFLPWERLLLALLVTLPLIASPIAGATRVVIPPFLLWASLAMTMRRAAMAGASSMAVGPASQ